MSKEEAVKVKDAVHKLQLCLLEGIEDEDKLFVAGSVLSQSDYHDVVTERSIANMCGYPLCQNTLPLDRPKKGRYRISLKEHKVYDLQETYMYCSTGCVVSSIAFARSIHEERSAELNPTKLNEVLGLFDKLRSTYSKDDLRVDRKSRQLELRVKEKIDVKDGEVSMEEWVGPSNAIDGYVPQRDQHVKPEQKKKHEKGTKSKHQQLSNQSPVPFNTMDFTSTVIITQDEYSVSKGPGLTKIASDDNTKDSKKVASDQPAISKRSLALKKYDESDIVAKNGFSSQVINDLTNKMNDELRISDLASAGPSTLNDVRPESEVNAVIPSGLVAKGVKSSLKHSNDKNFSRSVTWADEKNDGSRSQSLCTFNESVDITERSCKTPGLEEMEADGRYESAEACALALSQASAAVSSGSSDVFNAVAEAGIVILPPGEVDESEILEDDMLLTEQVHLKWPREPGMPDLNVLDSNDSWYDTPPEDFNLNLSPFATMFMSLFSWISSSSLAYIYGYDETFSENYSFINDREYPSKVVLSDGRSSEIKQALAACLARTLPGVITDLRIPMPVSTLEKELGHLIDTMTFMDALPPLRVKQWQIVVLLFLDALSVSRIPELSRYMTTSRRIWLPKIMEAAMISGEEYEILKDLMIPLGRVPQLASQSGG